jgi:hypothetical protein
MKIALIVVGVIGILIGLAVSGVTFGLHLSRPRHISMDEALPAIIGGCCCSGVSLPIAAGGVVWMLMAPKTDAPNKTAPRDDDED